MKAFPVLALLLPLVAVGCGRTAEKEAAAPATQVPVRTVEARATNASLPVRATGLLQRREEVDLSFKIGGLVREVRVRVGDTVAAGDLLAALQATEIDAQLALARAAETKARRDVARVEALAADKVATLENLQDARTALEAATAQVQIAEFNQRHAVIFAPSNGRILRRNAEPNELVAPGRAIIGFAGEGEGWLAKAGLAEVAAREVRNGDAVEILNPKSGDAVARGLVSQVGEAVDPASRTIPVEVAIESAPAGYRSGSVVEMRIQPKPGAERIVVPASSLVAGVGRKAHVFVVEGSAARRRDVEVLEFSGSDAYVSGLERGIPVVAAGAEYLRDGVAVTIQP